ncbi:MAG TPA: type II secretion system protein [Sedimentisphaerales bacterium]|nr:type II secretion system protein [Sedimentisphaerales bacterium]
MRRKGFTLVELLVVIAIIAMLLAILMPALARVRTLAYQMLCGTNLKGIANAILVYSQDNAERYPVAGVPGGLWQNTGVHPTGSLRGGDAAQGWQWDDTRKPTALSPVPQRATVSASFFLLVRYADVSVASFVCRAGIQTSMNMNAILAGLAGATTERGLAPTAANQARDVTEAWDFSNLPSRYVSYAYAYPWDRNMAPSPSSKSGVALAGDLNPWITLSGDSPRWHDGVGRSGDNFGVDATPRIYDSPQLIRAAEARRDSWVAGNSLAHDQGGQNILFNDMHVSFSRQPNPDAAVQNDNVYTTWHQAVPTEAWHRGRGARPLNTGNADAAMRPRSRDDSYLIQW